MHDAGEADFGNDIRGECMKIGQCSGIEFEGAER